MRARVFFPLIILLALAMVAYALKPLYLKKPHTGQDYIHTSAGLFIDGKALNNLVKYDASKFAVSLAPGTANPQKGPRFIALANSTKDDGVVFDLPPALVAELAQKPAYSIVINYLPINTSPAGFVKFSFVNSDDNSQDFVITNPKGSKISRFNFIGERKAFKQIVINPALEGQDHGIEVLSVLIEN